MRISGPSAAEFIWKEIGGVPLLEKGCFVGSALEDVVCYYIKFCNEFNADSVAVVLVHECCVRIGNNNFLEPV